MQCTYHSLEMPSHKPSALPLAEFMADVLEMGRDLDSRNGRVRDLVCSHGSVFVHLAWSCLCYILNIRDMSAYTHFEVEFSEVLPNQASLTIVACVCQSPSLVSVTNYILLDFIKAGQALVFDWSHAAASVLEVSCNAKTNSSLVLSGWLHDLPSMPQPR